MSIEDEFFIKKSINNVDFIFTTGENNFDMAIKNKSFEENLSLIKETFSLKDIGYLYQVHSAIVKEYDGIPTEGDAIYTNEKNIALGVFTADCVPVLLYDMEKKVIAAIHSGWKGTYDEITVKTIEAMKARFNCCGKDIIAVIGPHIRQCCYEVSEEIIDKFKEKAIYENYSINQGRYLNLYQCVRDQLKSEGVLEENIHDAALCTKCSDSIKLHSYRRDKELSGRIFSFLYLK